jgi:hypothetical protein
MEPTQPGIEKRATGAGFLLTVLAPADALCEQEAALFAAPTCRLP